MLGLEEGSAFGETVTREAWFALFRLTATLVRKESALDEYMDLSPGSSAAMTDDRWLHTIPELSILAATWTHPPLNSGLSAATATFAVSLLAGGSVDEIAYLADRSVASDKIAKRKVWSPSLRGAPAWWNEMWVAHASVHATVGRHWSPTLEGVDPNCLPGALGDEQMAEFGGLFVGTMDDKAKVFGAVCVARALGAPTWRQAWRDLGYSVDIRRRSWLELPITKIRAAGNERELARAAFRVAASSEEWCAVDYGAARTRLAGLVEIDEAVWFKMLSDLGLHGGRRAERSKYGAMWIWSQATGGDFRFSPAYLSAEERGVARSTMVTSYRRMEKLIQREPRLGAALFVLIEGDAPAGIVWPVGEH